MDSVQRVCGTTSREIRWNMEQRYQLAGAPIFSAPSQIDVG